MGGERGLSNTSRVGLGALGSALFHGGMAFFSLMHVPAAIAVLQAITEVIAPTRDAKYKVDLALIKCGVDCNGSSTPRLQYIRTTLLHKKEK